MLEPVASNQRLVPNPYPQSLVASPESRVPVSLKGAERPSVFDVKPALFHLLLGALAAVFLEHAAVEQVDRTVGVACVARVVGDHADRRAFAVQLAEQFH